MQPRKTDLARTALQAHRAPLDMRQRRLLILCDGQRTVADLTGLLGQEAPAMVIQLVQAGYLSTGTGATTPAPSTAAAVAPVPTPPAATPAAPMAAVDAIKTLRRFTSTPSAWLIKNSSRLMKWETIFPHWVRGYCKSVVTEMPP